MPEALILLHPTDNVLVCRETIAPGTVATIDGEAVTITQPIEVGHKVARVDLRPGDKILKYGAPIGSMTKDTPRGGHVHMHNMQSDYIPSHTRNASGGAA
ncbi:UxaA family hydrolase [Asticcacaulis sp. BYS171W]|uniref:UxaA family hydrolase n=1 Tax=Asticcacaulis aquaticus TaxID=2984212 RepID=A0ABT5HYS3_9CAUL|nr:UxaA family hydrolase [Asticcacaulis aquaticus]MDC7685072.1 UxaA family hydrolase [Asticcacaulis aquaticus]